MIWKISDLKKKQKSVSFKNKTKKSILISKKNHVFRCISFSSRSHECGRTNE